MTSAGSWVDIGTPLSCQPPLLHLLFISAQALCFTKPKRCQARSPNKQINVEKHMTRYLGPSLPTVLLGNTNSKPYTLNLLIEGQRLLNSVGK